MWSVQSSTELCSKLLLLLRINVALCVSHTNTSSSVSIYMYLVYVSLVKPSCSSPPSLKKSWVESLRWLASCPTKEQSWPRHTTCCGRTGASPLVRLVVSAHEVATTRRHCPAADFWTFCVCAADLELYNEALKVIHDFPQHYPFEVAARGWRWTFKDRLNCLCCASVLFFLNVDLYMFVLSDKFWK